MIGYWIVEGLVEEMGNWQAEHDERACDTEQTRKLVFVGKM